MALARLAAVDQATLRTASGTAGAWVSPIAPAVAPLATPTGRGPILGAQNPAGPAPVGPDGDAGPC